MLSAFVQQADSAVLEKLLHVGGGPAKNLSLKFHTMYHTEIFLISGRIIRFLQNLGKENQKLCLSMKIIAEKK